ncbi:hypothetical protein [Pseudoalteromonas piscicida]
MKVKLVALASILVQLPVIASTLEVYDSGFQSSYFCLTNQLYGNGTPKYCGATGTYSYKHIPVAVEQNSNRFEVFSNNENGALVTYIVKNYNEKVRVHIEPEWSDAHTNAVVDLDSAGYVYVQLSSRGLGNKYRSGHLYKSTTPYGTSFVKLKGLPNHGDFNQSYPQMHYDYSKLTIFTKYEPFPQGVGSVRTLWVDNNGNETKLVSGSHYAVSDTNDDGEIYVAFNYHPKVSNSGSAPYYDIDKRANIHLIKSFTNNPTQWYTAKGEKLTLPIAENDPRTLVYNTESKGTLVYLKDIVAEESGTAGGVHILFTESTSKDPTTGERFTREIDVRRPERHGNIDVNTYTFGKVNHNYSAATYLTDSFGWNVRHALVNGDNGIPYFGGNIKVFDHSRNGWAQTDTYSDGANYSYIRQVRGANSKAVASKGIGEIDHSNTQIRIEVK